VKSIRFPGNAGIVRTVSAVVAALAACTVCAGVATAQTYPAQPVKIILGFGPGSGTDVIARYVGEALGKRMNQSFVVENRAGASGNIGTDYAAAARPDGHILFLSSTSGVVNEITNPIPPKAKLARDFDPIALSGSVPFALAVVPADVPGNWDELIAEARRAADETPQIADIVEPTPQARQSANALAAMFSPAAPPAAPAPMPMPEAAPAPAPVVASVPDAGTDRTTDVVRAPMVSLEPAWPEKALDIHRTLSARGMDPELVTEVVAEAVEHMLPFSSEGSLRPLVAGQLARCLPPMPRRRPGKLVIGFVGAGGSGKTRCSARLALAYARRGTRPVACLTLRPKDRGAELLADLSAAGIPVHAAEDATAAPEFHRHQIVVAGAGVDTPGVSPRAEAELRQLAAELRQLQHANMAEMLATFVAALDADLLGADEAFLASTTREIQPIRSVDGTELDAAPGPRTLEAQEAFQAVLARELGD